MGLVEKGGNMYTLEGGNGAVRWQVCGAGLGSVMGFGEVWGAEVSMRKVMGEIW